MIVAEVIQPARPLVPFDARVVADRTSTVVALRGEADIYTLPAVVGALTSVTSEHQGPVIVDLAETSFIDSGTLLAIGHAAQILAYSDRTLTVQEPSRMASRLLAFLGLSDLSAHVCHEAVATTERRHPCTSDSGPSC